MCGICGFIGNGELSDLQRMTAALAHRGPDAEGMWHDAERGVYLGHRRLSIIDLTDGVQPMWTGDRQLCIVFNGEIYNHLELRAELQKRGHTFQTDHSDTEALLHAYREWGHGFVSRLNGMWAFALLDLRAGELMLSRDRFGQKPLFYTEQNGVFAFASEVTALTEHARVNASVSPMALRKYFAYGYVPAPHSLYEHIHKLPAGHNLVVQCADRSVSTSKYWDFVIEPFERVPADPEREWGAELRRLLKQAVSRRLMSDVPLGVLLSGGIDSSAIAAFATELAGADRVRSFAIGFDEQSFDESAWSGRVAGLLGTEHHAQTLSLGAGKTLLPEIVAKLDEPMGDSSLLPTYLLCQVTRETVTVALGGDGGDELLAGYDPFRALRLAAFYDRVVPKPLHRALRLVMARLPVSHRNMSLDFKLKRTLRGLSYPRPYWNSVWLGPLDPVGLDELFGDSCDLEELYSEALEAWDACTQDDLVDRTLQFYTKLYLQDDILVKVDRASMMHSLEVRSPFLDIELVDFLRRIPSRFKYRGGTTKYIFKQAMQSVLPTEIVNRSKKGFGVPIGKWFKNGDLAVTPGSDAFGMLDRACIERLTREQQAGQHDHRATLWNLWLLEQSASRA